MPMHACPSCACHIVEGTCTCPHCGASVCVKTPKLSGAAVIMGLALTGSLAACQAEYGTATMIPDDDGDGWYADDCDDGDPEVHPEAEETPGDGVDSNCDEDDDT